MQALGVDWPGWGVVPWVLLPLLAPLVIAQAPLNQRVLVVYNAEMPQSKQIAAYYMSKRAIPERNRCKVDVSSPDQLNQDEFDSSLKRPIRKCIERAGKNKILYIVFSYKTPWLLEIGPQTYALDQFIADIWDEYLPERAATRRRFSLILV